MLAKKRKLNLRQISQRELLNSGLQWRSPSCWAVYDFQGKETSQAAVIIPKSVVLKSSARNTLRREIFNLISPQLEELKRLRLIIRVTRNDFLSKTESERSKLLKDLFREITENSPE